MSSLVCRVAGDREFEKIVKLRSSFSELTGKIPTSDVVYWQRAKLVVQTFQIITIGKCGYGKSSLLNSLIGENLFTVNHVNVGTVEMQSVEYSLPWGRNLFLSLADLPGIGESLTKNQEHIELYRKALATAHIVIYVVRADQRDLTIDQWVFSTLLSSDLVKSQKVIIAVNQVDKIHPINRDSPFNLTSDQKRNLSDKIEVLSKELLLSRDNIIGVSATENYGIDPLIRAIVGRL